MEDSMQNPLLDEIFDGTLDGDVEYVSEKVQEALDTGIEPEVILNRALIAAMLEVGELYEEGEYFVPEMLMAARAMQAALGVLRRALVNSPLRPVGTVVICTVEDDFHELGKNLVAMMLEGAGFAVRNLGANVPPHRLVEAVRAGGVDVVALSTLLLTTTPNMKEVIDALAVAGLRKQVKVIVGGAPVTAQFARAIGADGYAPDASQAVKVIRSWLEEKQAVLA
jgi:5-methyltetrahydrofolate--homocysteine methyltransferase